MKTYKEFISEGVFKQASLRTITSNKPVDFDIFINPSNSEFNQLYTFAKSQKDMFIRGYVSPKNDVYLWRTDAMHADVLYKYEKEMGANADDLEEDIPLDETGFCFVLDLNNNILQLSDWHDDNPMVDDTFIKKAQQKHRVLSRYKIKMK